MLLRLTLPPILAVAEPLLAEAPLGFNCRLLKVEYLEVVLHQPAGNQECSNYMFSKLNGQGTPLLQYPKIPCLYIYKNTTTKKSRGYAQRLEIGLISS